MPNQIAIDGNNNNRNIDSEKSTDTDNHPRIHRPPAMIKNTKHTNGVVLIKIIAIGILFHLAAILSIFDIYFKSPLEHGQAPTESLPNAPAKRLVFIVGDGLRADKCFYMEKNGSPRAPFLHQMALSGSFGVSHTRVPTESRPGHVAMLAGFYEDPSAVTKGWKENPVEYDHLLHRAKHAFAFGAPEIMALFRGDRVQSFAYSQQMVDFGSLNVLQQDQWSFDRLYELFERAKTDLDLNDKLRSDQVFFFLHLLGHDTNGHSYGPQSDEYAENTRYIDRKIQELTTKFSEFYNDERTAFVFSADHGMSDGRSHGDGHPDNTRTPLVAWGAGVAGPRQDKASHSHRDGFSLGWGQLAGYERRDIRQADLTVLMSSLLGITIPLQCEGHLPVDYFANTKYTRTALLRNVQQMIENYRVKEERQRRRHRVGSRFRPFKDVSVREADDRLKAIVKLTDHEQTVSHCFDLMNVTERGIKYLNNYDQTLLFSLLTLSYVGWIAFGVLAVIKYYSAFGKFYVDRTSLTDRSYMASLAVMGGLFSILYGRTAPHHYYLYAFFPVWFLKQLLQSRDLFAIAYTQSNLIFDAKSVTVIAQFLVVSELIVLAYFDRRIMSVLLLVLKADFDLPRMATSLFTLIPPIKEPSRVYQMAGWLGGSAVLWREGQHTSLLLETVAFLAVAISDHSLSNKMGLPIGCQIANWLTVGCSLFSLLSMAFRRDKKRPLLSVFAALLPLLTVLSVSYEVAFFTCFYLYLNRLIASQVANRADDGKDNDKVCSDAKRLENDHPRWIQISDIRIAGDFLVALNMAFFGTGNIASLSSFMLPSVYRLVTVFRPFLMAAILAFKQSLPLIVLSVFIILRSRREELPDFCLILLSCALIDVVTLQFFFLVTNVGSWLEIGMGISRFVISNVFILIGLLLYGVGKALLS